MPLPASKAGPYEPPPEPLNAVEQPHPIKLGRNAAIPLIARLVWPDRTEYRAVRAWNWNRDYVHVSWPPEKDDPGAHCWLPVTEVWRVLPPELLREP